FLPVCARHLFSVTTELRANWMFQITEGEGRGAWRDATDRFVLLWGVALSLATPLPLELRLLGWRGLAEAVLFLAMGLLTYEVVFFSWEKRPFTCSHLPGKTPMWVRALQFFGLIALAPVLHAMLLATLNNRIAFLIVLAVMTAAWARVHVMRRLSGGELRLKYEESPD